MAERMNALDPFDPFRGVLSKLRGYGLRFAAVLWSVRRACGQITPNGPIGAGIMTHDRGGRPGGLLRAARRPGPRPGGGRSAQPGVARRLLGLLARRPGRGGFNRTEAFQVVRDRRDVRTSEALAPASQLLVWATTSPPSG